MKFGPDPDAWALWPTVDPSPDAEMPPAHEMHCATKAPTLTFVHLRRIRDVPKKTVILNA